MTTDIGQAASERVTGEAAQAMQKAIEETGGREVFFAGTLNKEGRVEAVRVCARGHETAVPALLEHVKPGEVVIHNHPSGNISPSDPDLKLSTLFGHQGNGVYIVDNDVSRVYVVVEPFLEREVRKISPQALGRALAPDSRLARTIPRFEIRPQQVQMMEAVARAFNEDEVAIVEAPTGVGKTMAYLIPAVQWALRNRERVVIATKTINLQEQLMQKDIPVLARCCKEPFTAVLVKGRQNYLCRRKLQRALQEAQLFDDPDQQAQLQAIADWAEVTQDGTLSDLPFVPERELWSRLCSEPDTCSFTHCPSPSRCYIGKARREMAKADIIVANHHMLFSDLAVKKETGNFQSTGVLPPYRRVILDEAHNIEDSATEYFGAEATRGGVLALFARFTRVERNQERGLLPYIKLKLIKDFPDVSAAEVNDLLEFIDNELTPALAVARDRLVDVFDVLRGYVADRCRQVGRDIQWRLTEETLRDPALRQIHAAQVLPAVEVVLSASRLCINLFERLERLEIPFEARESPLTGELLQLNAYGTRLARIGSVMAEITDENLDPSTVRWIAIDALNDRYCRVARCPLEVAESLAEWLYGNLKTVVMTSATLSVQRRFEYLHRRLGVDRIKGRVVESHSLDSPFDFQRQALLAIPMDLPSPDARSFLEAVVEHVRQTLVITRGHAFVLFTSFQALGFVYRRLEDELRAMGIAPMKQGSMNRSLLLDRFRTTPSSALFATDSFWEGVDVPGEALQCVILPKLPFRVPTEPIQEARAEAIDAAGGNSFMEFTVPQAVIKFRQGLGRLIRRKSDRGAIVVLDRRIVTKHYGRVFLESLPEMRMVRGPRSKVYAEMEEFFRQGKAEEHG